MTNPTTDASRVAFEQWACITKGWNVERWEDGRYKFHHDAWLSWQAALATKQPMPLSEDATRVALLKRIDNAEGNGCKCNAWYSSKCVCGADWTNSEVYKAQLIAHDAATSIKPAAVSEDALVAQNATYYAWLIEQRDANGKPTWLKIDNFIHEQTDNAWEAVHFGRKVDAEAYAAGNEDEVIYITEHAFPAPTSIKPTSDKGGVK